MTGYSLARGSIPNRDFPPCHIGPMPIQNPVQCLPGVKRPIRQADISLSSAGEVKDVWNFASTPPCFFMVWYIRTGAILRTVMTKIYCF